MADFSINTNRGAMQALQSLRSVQKDMDVTSKRIQTGLKVADAMDDPGTFAVAQGIRGKIKSFEAVQQSLAFGKGLSDVTNAAYKGITDMVGQMRAKIGQLADGSISAAQRTTYTADLTKMRSQIDNFINGANYNGSNQLKNGGAAKNFLADPEGGTVSLAYTDVTALKTTLDAAVDVSTAAAATTTLGALDTFEAAVNTAMSSNAQDAKFIENHSDFTKAIVDATKKGLGALVDADLPQESANLTSLQTRQQLAIQTLSMANQAPQAMLSLFR